MDTIQYEDIDKAALRQAFKAMLDEAGWRYHPDLSTHSLEILVEEAITAGDIKKDKARLLSELVSKGGH